MDNNSPKVTFEFNGKTTISSNGTALEKVVNELMKEQRDKILEEIGNSSKKTYNIKQSIDDTHSFTNTLDYKLKQKTDTSEGWFDKYLKPKNTKDQKEYNQIIKDLEEFSKTCVNIQEKYLKESQVLEQKYASAPESQKGDIKKQMDLHKKKYANDYVNSSDQFKNIAGNLNKQSTKALNQIYNDIKGLDTSELTPENLKKYQDALEKMQTEFRERNPFKQMGRDYNNIIDSIKNGGDVKGAVAGLEKSFGSVKSQLTGTLKPFESLFYSDDKEKNEKNQYKLENIKYIAGNVEQIAGGVFDIGKGAASIFSGDIIGGSMSVIKGVGSILSIGGKVKQMNKEARDKVEKFNRTAEIGESEYDREQRAKEISKIDKKGGTLAYNEKFVNTLIGADGQSGQKKANKDTYDKLYAQLADEKYVKGQKYEHGTWFKKAKITNEYDTLKDKSYEDLEKLSMEGKLEGKALEIFNQLKKLKAEGEDIDKKLEEQKNAMNQAFTGTTSNAIADSIIKGFAEGKRSAADFANDFEKLMNDAVLNGVKLKALEEPLAGWYEKFAEKTSDKEGLTEAEIEELRQEYNKIIEKAAKQLEETQKITGLKKPEDPNANRTVSSKGLAALSQDSAGELNGRFTTMLMLQDEMNNNLKNIAALNSPLTNGLGALSLIADNTSHCIRLDNIDTSIEKMNKSIETIVRDGIYLKK